LVRGILFLPCRGLEPGRFTNIKYLAADFKINLVPFIGIFFYILNACLNVLLFIPLGFFLPLLWEKFRSLRSAAAAGLCAAVFVEFMQIFTYRVTDIDDLLINILGALLGFLAANALIRGLPARSPPAPKSGTCI